MKIRYFLFTAVLATAILCSGGLGSAQTTNVAGISGSTDNSALIAQLMQEIAALQAQLQAMQNQHSTTTITTPATWCYTFTKNLGFADSGSNDVIQLHKALQKEGICSSSDGISCGSDQGNMYYVDTSAAVIKFQQKYGIYPLSGYVGTATRARLNSLYGCSNTISPISLTTPGVGTQWTEGSMQAITWTGGQYASGTYHGNIDIFLYSGSCNGDLSCIRASTQTITAMADISNYMNWQVGKVYGSNALVTPGNYFIEVCTGGNGDATKELYCSTNDNIFNISSANSSQSIKILNVAYSPSSPNVSDLITANVTITNNSSTDYNTPFKVNFGGDAVTVNSLAAGATTIVTIPNAFTFQTPGPETVYTNIIYPISVGSPEGNVGDNVATVITFNSSTSTTLSITVTSPNGGETFSQGQSIPISFSTNLTDQQDPSGVNIALYGGTSNDIQTYNYIQTIVNQWVDGSPYNWSVPSSLPAGKYIIYIVPNQLVSGVSSSGLFDFSNNYFTITAAGNVTADGYPTYYYGDSSVNGVYGNCDPTYGTGICSSASYIANCNWVSSKLGIVQAAIVNNSQHSASNITAINVISCAAFNGFGGSSIVTCPTGTSYSYCVQNKNDGAANSVLLGVTENSSSAGTLATPALVVATSTPSQYIADANGAANATQAVYNFVATGNSVTINELKFTITPSNTVTYICAGSVCAAPVGGVADLAGLQYPLTSGAGISQAFKVSYGSVIYGDFDPGATSTIALTSVVYTSGGTTHTLTINVPAPTMTLVGSAPTVSVSSATNAGLIMGINQISQIAVSANSQGPIKVRTITFNLGLNGFYANPIASPYITNGTTIIAGSSCTVSGNTIVCSLGSGYASDYSIVAGQSQPFKLYATVNGSVAGPGTVISTSLVPSEFVWDDTVTNGAYGTGLTGSLIYNFPTSSYSITANSNTLQDSLLASISDALAKIAAEIQAMLNK